MKDARVNVKAFNNRLAKQELELESYTRNISDENSTCRQALYQACEYSGSVLYIVRMLDC